MEHSDSLKSKQTCAVLNNTAHFAISVLDIHFLVFVVVVAQMMVIFWYSWWWFLK